MRISKAVTTSAGFDADFWKISTVVINYNQRSAQISYSLWKDEATRDAGATPASDKVLNINEPNFTTYFDESITDPVLPNCYNAVLALDAAAAGGSIV